VQRGYFQWSALRVTAGHHDFRIGIFTMYAANSGTRVLIGRGRDRTSVKDHHVGIEC
jgi:hypothetical protein